MCEVLHVAVSTTPKTDYTLKRYDFCLETQADMEDREFATRLIFSDEVTLHLSSILYRHNVRIRGTDTP